MYDANINMLKRMIINPEISIKTYINNIVVLFCISYKKKKSNKDDDVSTSESEDNSSDSDESDVNI